MNLCVTLNPCLDKSLVVPPWQPGSHQVRGRSFQQVVGGKGVNVARGLKRLGQGACPALFLGGQLGKLCARLLREQDGFEPLVTWSDEPTREILTVRTEQTADQTAFFDPNPTIRPAERDTFASQLKTAFERGPKWCAMSGSSPCATTDDLFADLTTCARQAGIHTLVDTYGSSLDHALQAAPEVVKINRRECELVIGARLDSPSAVREALQRIRSHGVKFAAVTFAADGLAAAWDNVICAWKPPAIQVVNPIGAGDAMVAGLIDAFIRGEPAHAAFRWAMACAVSSVGHWVACDIRRADVRRMEPRIVQCELDALFRKQK